MTTKPETSPRQTNLKLAAALQPPAGSAKRLGVSLFDRASSLLLALLVLLGVAVIGVVIVYFSGRVFHPATQAVPVNVADLGIPREGKPGGGGRDLEEPASEEIPELAEQPAADKLAAVTDTLASRDSLFEDIAISARVLDGDDRPIGGSFHHVVEGKVPRGDRWEIRFQVSDLEAYARTLDFFGIELAVMDGESNRVEYASNLSKPKPDRRTGAPDQESRLYMTWRSGRLQSADRDLLAKAGIEVGSNISMQFYPAKVENDLAAKELKYAGNHTIDEIRKTIFGVKQSGESYSFYVVGQRY